MSSRPSIPDAPAVSPPAAADPYFVPFGTWGYPYPERTADIAGHRISYMDVGEGDPVVLVHPVATGGYFWSLNTPKIGAGRRLIIPDVLGHGRSAKPDIPYRIPDLVDAVCGLCDLLGVTRATWIGNSMGGNICLEAALRRPDLVGRLVVESPAGVQILPEGLVSGAVSFFERALAPVLVRLPPSLPAIDAGVRWVFVRQPPQVRALIPFYHGLARDGEYAERTRAVARIIRSVVEEPCRLRVHRIGVPTLVLWGDMDRLLPLRYGRYLAKAVPGARLTIFHRTGHCPHVERPRTFNRVVCRWLDAGHAPAIV